MNLDLCSGFMEVVVGQASFPFHISQQFQLILVDIRVEKIQIKMRQKSYEIGDKILAFCLHSDTRY